MIEFARNATVSGDSGTVAGVALSSVIDLYALPLMSVRRFDSDAFAMKGGWSAYTLDPLIGDVTALHVRRTTSSRLDSFDSIDGSARFAAWLWFTFIKYFIPACVFLVE